MLNQHDLTGRNVLITGGSQGLGQALAAQLTGRGAAVALVARGEGALVETVATLTAAGATAHAIPGDMGRAGDIARIAGTAAALLGPIDTVIHCASTLGPTPMPHLLDLPVGALEEVFAVNLLGPYRLTAALLGQMILAGGGQVIFISSDAAVEAYPGWGAYSAAKAALDHLGRVWAAELAEQNIHFLMIDPGEMNTRMHAAALPDADPATLADPADVAAAILSLDAPTGTRLSIGGSP